MNFRERIQFLAQLYILRETQAQYMATFVRSGDLASARVAEQEYQRTVKRIKQEGGK